MSFDWQLWLATAPTHSTLALLCTKYCEHYLYAEDLCTASLRQQYCKTKRNKTKQKKMLFLPKYHSQRHDWLRKGKVVSLKSFKRKVLIKRFLLPPRYYYPNAWATDWILCGLITIKRTVIPQHHYNYHPPRNCPGIIHICIKNCVEDAPTAEQTDLQFPAACCIMTTQQRNHGVTTLISM